MSLLNSLLTPGGGLSTILPSGQIYVGNASNEATPVTMSGDGTLNNTGVFTIKTDVALAGSPTTTTQLSSDSSTKLATTAFTQAAIAATANVYSETFNATTDWGVASGGLYTITITAATHGFGLNVSDIVVYETVGSDNIQTTPNQVILDIVTGDVSFNVSEVPEGRFAGKVVVIKGIAGGAGVGITSLNELVDEVQFFDVGTDGFDFNIVSAGNTHTFNIPDAGINIDRGLITDEIQSIEGTKTFVVETATSAKGLGIYNPDTTDNNIITFNFETDTTGAGAQTQFTSAFIGTQIVDHNHATLSCVFSLNTYRNGALETVLGYDQLGVLSTSAKSVSIPGTVSQDSLTINNGNIRANNGFISTGATLDVLSGQGFNQGMNSIGGQINIPAGSPVTGTNIFGTNLAQGFIWSEDIDGGLIPEVGLCGVGYVGYLLGQVSGKTIDTINMEVAGVSDQGSVSGSVVTNLNMHTSLGVVGDAMNLTVVNTRFYHVPTNAGGYATNEFGFINNSPLLDNYLEKSLTIGGGADGKTTNADIALEIKSLKTIKLSSFTTVQKNAIASPEEGMILIDSDLDKMCVYLAGGWQTVTST